MNNTDLTFRTQQGRFNYRVGAVIIENGKLLMVKNDRDRYYYSVGGRVLMGEDSVCAVERECFEELGVRLKAGRLLFVHENFFTEETTKEYFHEVALFYLMRLRKPLGEITHESRASTGFAEQFVWLPIDELSSFHLYPKFFTRELLLRLPSRPKSFIEKDAK